MSTVRTVAYVDSIEPATAAEGLRINLDVHFNGKLATIWMPVLEPLPSENGTETHQRSLREVVEALQHCATAKHGILWPPSSYRKSA